MWITVVYRQHNSCSNVIFLLASTTVPSMVRWFQNLFHVASVKHDLQHGQATRKSKAGTHEPPECTDVGNSGAKGQLAVHSFDRATEKSTVGHPTATVVAVKLVQIPLVQTVHVLQYCSRSTFQTYDQPLSRHRKLETGRLSYFCTSALYSESAYSRTSTGAFAFLPVGLVLLRCNLGLGDRQFSSAQ